MSRKQQEPQGLAVGSALVAATRQARDKVAAARQALDEAVHALLHCRQLAVGTQQSAVERAFLGAISETEAARDALSISTPR